jgi:hypothetical protein
MLYVLDVIVNSFHIDWDRCMKCITDQCTEIGLLFITTIQHHTMKFADYDHFHKRHQYKKIKEVDFHGRCWYCAYCFLSLLK